MKVITFFIALAVVLSGCTSTQPYKPYNSDRYVLNLKQTVVVPAGSSYAYVKAPGQVVKRNDIGTYELYCKIAVPRSKSSGELVIQPDTFEIEGIYSRLASVYENEPYEFQLASSGTYGGIFRRGGNTQQDLELFFELSSVNQPQIQSISCVRFADPVYYNLPKLDEVDAILGNLAEIKHR